MKGRYEAFILFSGSYYTLTNVINVYSSKTEAAGAIGCNSSSTISIALKEFKRKKNSDLKKKFFSYLIFKRTQ